MINKRKYYPVRAGNSLSELKRWIKWAKEDHSGQRFIIEDIYSKRMKSKEKAYWKMRYKIGMEDKYIVYGSY